MPEQYNSEPRKMTTKNYEITKYVIRNHCTLVNLMEFKIDLFINCYAY